MVVQDAFDHLLTLRRPG